MTWFALALFAPLLYAIVNLLDDNLLQHVYRSAHVGTIISGFFGLLPTLIILALGKSGALPLDMLLLSIGAGVATTIAIYHYLVGLGRENPSVVVALFSLSPAIIPFIAYFLVDERLSLHAYIGFGIVVVAGLAYSMVDLKGFKLSSALVPVLVSALLLDGVSLTNKYIYSHVDFFASYVYYGVGMALGALLFMTMLKTEDRKILRGLHKKHSLLVLGVLIFNEFLGLLAGYMHDRALSLGPVSIVNVLENMQAAYLLLIAALLYPFWPKFFREAESGGIRLKLAIIVVMLGGVYLTVQ